MIPVSKRRLITTTVGIILAIAIIFTSYTLGNNMAKMQFYDEIEKNPYAIVRVVSGNFSNMMDAYNQIEKLPHVRSAIFSIMTFGRCGGNYTSLSIPVIYPKGYKLTLLNGTTPKNPKEVIVGAYYFKMFNWSIGENLSIWFYTSRGILEENYTIVGVANLKAPLGNFEEGGNAVLKGIFVSGEEMQYLNRSGVNINGHLGVALDPKYLLNSADYNEAYRKIMTIENEINFILYDDNISIEEYQSTYYGSFGESYLLEAIFFSLPVIIMGIYLSKVGIEIEFLERRREFGILKIRGFTGRGLGKFIFIEAAVYSLIGGVVGYAIGEALASLSNIVFFKIPYFFLDWNILNLIVSIIIATLLFLVALYSPWKKIKKEPIINLISHYSQSFKKAEYTGGMKDLITSALFWIYLALVIWLSNSVNISGGFNILVIIAYILLSTIIFFFPVVLIVLPLTMSRLLTLGTTRIYKFVASWIAKLFKTSGELAERSIERSPRRAAYLAFILAFILTLSSFLAVAMESANRLGEIEREADVGGDLEIFVDNLNIPWKILNNTKNVASYVIVYRTNISGYGEYGVPHYGVNMEKYLKTIYNGNLFLKEGNVNHMGIVVTTSYARSNNIRVGDTIQIDSKSGVKEYPVEAIMYSFPGIGEAEFLFDLKDPEGMPHLIIVRAKNLGALESELNESGYNYNVKPPKDEMEDQQISLINTLLIYLVILGAASIFIVQYSSLLNRRGEIALYKVRGARNGQIAAMLMTEGLTVIVISLIIGVTVGIILAYAMSSLVILSGTSPPVFVIGHAFALYTAILVVAYILSQYALSYIFARTKPSEVIRGLGGEI